MAKMAHACVLMRAGKGQMWSPSDDSQVPEYYRQWAATIERLGTMSSCARWPR